jgi:glycosyltransferase involved in cell wall biosynthesis
LAACAPVAGGVGPAVKQGHRLRIAMTADPELPVPPRFYGGIERIIDLLVRGLRARGHEVTLFAHADSTTNAQIVGYRRRSSHSLFDTARNSTLIARNVYLGNYDILHSFSRLAYLLPLMPLGLPKLMTYQRQITRRSVALAHALSRGSLQFSAISRKMMAPVQDIGVWHLVYNGVPMEAFRFSANVAADAPLVFLGRIEHIKGTHLAIEIARRAGVPLVIAGNIPSEHQGYFDKNVKPWIDGSSVKYIGSVDDRQKNELLSQARALLMPILWEEPFGIVMAESLACGTPVVGFSRGSVPEVVEDGVTGFVRENIDDLIEAVVKINKISRANCRSSAEQKFSNDVVVERYLDIYRTLRATQTGQE